MTAQQLREKAVLERLHNFGRASGLVPKMGLADFKTLVDVQGLLHELLDQLAAADKWIIQRGREQPDHACAKCVPNGDMIVDGWLCAYHAAKARAALADGEGVGK